MIDGTGAKGADVDVLIAGETIEAVERLGDVEADRVINAEGRVVCPGFIDPHNHANTEIKGGIVQYPMADNLVRQGITTLVCNQCGGSTYPIAPFLDDVDRVRPVTNVAMLASHGRTRNAAMEQTGSKTPGPAMWRVMRSLLMEEMESGAYGVTAGPLGQSLEELPTEELVEAGRAVAPFGGVYASHIRDEGETGSHLEAIEEVYTVAKEGGAKGHVSHLKLWGRPNWGKTEPVLAIFDRAQKEGVVLAADQYPYIGGYRGIYSLMWDYQREQQRDGAWRKGAAAEIRRQLDLLGGPRRVIICSHEKDDPIDGKYLADAAEFMSLSPEETVIDLFLRDPQPRLSAVLIMMQEEDVHVFMRSEHTMMGTDSHIRVPGSGACHPRNFGSYPRALGKYVREEKVVPMERMIHRMTARVADQFGVRNRGRLAPGAWADVVVFNPETVRDTSTWQNGYGDPIGVEWVIVNGGVTVAQSKTQDRGHGRALRRGED